MIDLKAKISTLNIFQLRELNALVVGRITAIGGPTASIPTPPVPGIMPATPHRPTRADFKYGDLIEFYSKRDHRTLRAVVERVNDKTLSCCVVETKQRWRVSPGLCRLVGADKVAPTVPSPAVAHAPPLVPHVPAAMPTAVGTGVW